MGQLRWFTRYNHDLGGWEVLQGNFRDSWYQHKFEAVNRCEYLNGIEQLT